MIGNVVFDTSKADGQFKKTARYKYINVFFFFFEMFFIFSFFQSNAKLRKLYPDYKFTSMEDGIQASVDWFVANYEAARK